MTALRAMTPNPECELCSGSGTDPVFFGDCTECWPPEPPRTRTRAYLSRNREELHHAHRQAVLVPPRRYYTVYEQAIKDEAEALADLYQAHPHKRPEIMRAMRRLARQHPRLSITVDGHRLPASLTHRLNRRLSS